MYQDVGRPLGLRSATTRQPHALANPDSLDAYITYAATR
jgi:hypothetical protein